MDLKNCCRFSVHNNTYLLVFNLVLKKKYLVQAFKTRNGLKPIQNRFKVKYSKKILLLYIIGLSFSGTQPRTTRPTPPRHRERLCTRHPRTTALTTQKELFQLKLPNLKLFSQVKFLYRFYM